MGASLAKLKDEIATTAGVTERERKLFSELELVESRYGAVALHIVSLSLDDKRDAAIGEMSANCRPLLAALIKAANEYIAHAQAAAADEVKAAESDYATSRSIMLGACALAIALAVGLAFTITRGLTRSLGAEPAEPNEAAQRFGLDGHGIGADRHRQR